MTTKNEAPPLAYRDEMGFLERFNYAYKHGTEAYERLPWSRPAAASPARDDQGRFSTTKKKRSEMTIPEKAAFIDKYGYDAFAALPYE